MPTTEERVNVLQERLERTGKMYEGETVKVWSLAGRRAQPAFHARQSCGAIRYSTDREVHTMTEVALSGARRCGRCSQSWSTAYRTWDTHLGQLRAALAWMSERDSTGTRLASGRAHLEALSELREALDSFALSHPAAAGATRLLEEICDAAEEVVCEEVMQVARAAQQLRDPELRSLRARILEAGHGAWAREQGALIHERVRASVLGGCVRDEERSIVQVLQSTLESVAEDGAASLEEVLTSEVSRWTKVHTVTLEHLVATNLDVHAHIRDGVLDLRALAQAAWEDSSAHARRQILSMCEEALEAALRAAPDARELVLLVHEEHMYAYHSGDSVEVELERFDRWGSTGLVARVVPRIIAELALAHCTEESVTAEIHAGEPESVYALAVGLAEGSLDQVEEALQSAREAHG